MLDFCVSIVNNFLVNITLDNESTNESLHIVVCTRLASAEKLQLISFVRFLLVLLLAYNAAIQVDNVVERRVLHFFNRTKYDFRFGREIVEFILVGQLLSTRANAAASLTISTSCRVIKLQ